MSVQVQPHQRWPSGSSVPLVALRFSPDELASRYGLEFEDHVDDLDCFKLAAIALPDGSQVWLERHEGDPATSTLAHVDAGANLSWALERIMQAFDLTTEDVVWVSPRVHANEQGENTSPVAP